MPLPIFLWAAGAIVFLSFIVSAILFRNPQSDWRFPIVVDIKYEFFGRKFIALIFALTRGCFLALFALIIVAGLYGSQSPLKNLAPTAVWVIGWIGITFLCALTTNVWPLINPWTTAYDVFAYLKKTMGLVSNISTYPKYPASFGVWPAVILFWYFAWFEIIWPASEIPSNLAWSLVFYSLITLSGMIIFGRDTWSNNCEFLTVFYHLVSRFSPIEFSTRPVPAKLWPAPARDKLQPKSPKRKEPWKTQSQFVIRPFGYGLTAPNKPSLSITAFTVLILSTVTFDGLLETPFCQDLISLLSSVQSMLPILIVVNNIFGTVSIGIETVYFLITPLLLTIVLSITCCFMLFINKEKHYDEAVNPSLEKRTLISLIWYLGIITPSLIPIAIGYHVAHYTSFLLVAGQLMIPLVSDPMGMGWDIFGTADYRVDIAIISTQFVWYLALLSVVLGHVIAVFVAHKIAARELKDTRWPISSQIPVALLMVAYTTLSLWILAQPIAKY